jgi:succinyl-diaminopimelate desuccinylase
MTIDPIALAQELIRRPSVTPADEGALDILAAVLDRLGFETHLLTFGKAPDGPVKNLFARRGSGGPHFAFAGHTDVVPAGDAAAWSLDPFAADIRNGQLVGRGAADMKGSIAAFVAAVARVGELPGSLSFVITGDEEGPATFGTVKLLEWMEAHGHVPDACLVGEPTSLRTLGDMVKVGRRGSLNAWITVNGAQGHVAYPDRADNPITRLVRLLDTLKSRKLDEGSDWFDPSNLEITDLAVGNPAMNVIPAQARARINIRFNDLHRGADLKAWIEEVVVEAAPAHELQVRISGEAFLTEPGLLSDTVAAAIEMVTGVTPELSTSGGTSDARFIRRLCPVVEFGLPGQSMHKVDEAVAVADIERLADIYAELLRRWYAGPR